jgi:hypothetical protein
MGNIEEGLFKGGDESPKEKKKKETGMFVHEIGTGQK